MKERLLIPGVSMVIGVIIVNINPEWINHPAFLTWTSISIVCAVFYIVEKEG